MTRSVPLALVAAAAISLAGCGSAERPSGAASADSFYTPADPPSSRYAIDARFGASGGVEGRETVTLKNSGIDPIGVVAFDWTIGSKSTLQVAAAGRRVFPPDGAAPAPQAGPVLVRLPGPLAPGASIDLDVTFAVKPASAKPIRDYLNGGFYPRLWWDGQERHDAFSVKLEVPEGMTVAASGRLDPKTGRYEASAARSFGVFFAKNLKTASREVDGVLITSYFTGKGAKAAAVCLETAADAVHFYKEWLGFYPFTYLDIIPGGSGRWGGYPVATGIVAIHGLETYVDGESPQHWQHITSHEIGHQYWGEWILDPDAPAWLWIAGGIFADTEYMTVRGFEPERRARWTRNYVHAIPAYWDLTLDAPPDREEKVKFDFNNTVIHSKGPAAMFALDAVLGRDAFLRVYKRCLRDFGGKRLGWRGFRAVAEAETGRDLGWFFDAWIRSDQYLCYAIDSKETRPDGNGGSETVVRVKRLGTMAMPLPVRATFEDGSSQTLAVDRTRPVTTLTFRGRSPLKDVAIDPERRFARVDAPRPKISAAAAEKLAFGWEPADAAAVYAALKGERFEAAALWYRLGADLYGANPDEAADCFARVTADAAAGTAYRLGADAWLGILEDLKGRRSSAISHYKAALTVDYAGQLRHDQYRITIDKAWLNERLATPFTKETPNRVPEHPTAAALTDFVDGLDWSGEGATALEVYRKTAGLEIADGGFWFKLGLLLFDGGARKEALDAFTRTAALEAEGATGFAARVWQGHMHDLLGHRDAALACYRDALKAEAGDAMRHSQWGLTIDRAWVEERIATPFTWPQR